MATPICPVCRKLVNERAVFALGHGYHPACFWPNGVPSSWGAQPVAWRYRSFADGQWSDWRHVDYEPQGGTTDTFQKEALFTHGVKAGPKPWEIPGPNQTNPPLPRDLDPSVPQGEGDGTSGVTVRFKCQGIDGRPLDCAEWCGDPKCHVGVAPSPQPIGFARQVENGNWVFIGFYEGRNPELPWQPVYLAPGVKGPDHG